MRLVIEDVQIPGPDGVSVSGPDVASSTCLENVATEIARAG